MGHHGKHIIDPETGLCEICDKGAIQEVQQGKRPGKQILYSNRDDEPTYRSTADEVPYTKDQYVYEVDDEPTPRRVRKTIYPAPTVRSRRVIYEQPTEEPIIVRRKVVRRDRTPPDDVIVRRAPPRRPSVFYYVDKDRQMVPQNQPPRLEPRRYVVYKNNPLPARVVRRQAQTPPSYSNDAVHPVPRRQVQTPQSYSSDTVHSVPRRQARTPSPYPSDAVHPVPRRHIKSDTEIVEQQQRTRRDEAYYSSSSLPSIRPEMYYIKAASSNDIHHSPLESPVRVSRESDVTPSKVVYQGNRNRKPNKVEPMERQSHNPPEPTVVRRVYKKLPPGKREPPEDAYTSKENHSPSPRRINKNPPPPPKHHRSSPEFSNRNNRSPEPATNPTIFYLRNTNEYQ